MAWSRVINAHLAGEDDAGSMVDLLIRRNQKSGGEPLDVAALRNEVATIFIAGQPIALTSIRITSGYA